MIQSKKIITLFFCMMYITISASYAQLNLSTDYFKIHIDKKGFITSMKSIIATREGIQVATFRHNSSDNPVFATSTVNPSSTLLRLCEQGSISENVTAKLSKESNYTKPTPVDLRGEVTGRPMRIVWDKLIFLLRADAAASLILDTASPKERSKIAPVAARFINALHNGKKITIVTMGTSLTGGAWPWPDVMINDWLNREFPRQVTCFNEGVGASSSSVGPGNNPALSGIGKLPAVIAHKPDVVFIEFATNDAYLPYKISLEESAKNLNVIIDGILEANRNTEIILQTMNTVIDKPGGSPNASSRPQLGEYNQLCRNVAKDRGLLIVDNYPNWERLMKTAPGRFDELVPDGIHPRFPGYREILLPELKKTLDPALNSTHKKNHIKQ